MSPKARKKYKCSALGGLTTVTLTVSSVERWGGNPPTALWNKIMDVKAQQAAAYYGKPGTIILVSEVGLRTSQP